MLRAAVAAQTSLGLKASEVMKSGGLVEDELVLSIIEERIKCEDCHRGFVLDGFPRTVKQAQMLDAILQTTNEIVRLVIALDAADHVLHIYLFANYSVDFRAEDLRKMGA
jgi:adenylate kinase